MTIINKGYDPEVAVDTLTPHPGNPRKGDLAKIKESIEANGFYGSLIVQYKTGVVLAGNHRLQAAMELGYTHVPCTFVDVTEEQATKILLADNRVNDLATYDNAKLLDLLNEIGGADDVDSLLGSGFSQYDMAEIERKVALLEVPLDLGTAPTGTHPEGSGQDSSSGQQEPPEQGAPGAAPGAPKASHVYMVNLFLNTGNAPEFMQMIDRLKLEFDVDNVTDAVWGAVSRAYDSLD